MFKRLNPALVFALLVLIVALQGFAFARSMLRATGGRWILPLDDAYIHQQYARQAASGYPFRYNGEDAPTSGATSLLYPFLLAIPWLLGVRGDGLSAFAFLMGAACLLWSTIVSMRIAGRLYDRWFAEQHSAPLWPSLLAAFLVLSNGALLWAFFSGMETALFTALLLCILEAKLVGHNEGLALWGALLALTRPEALPVLVGIFGVAVGERFWNEGSSRKPWSWSYIVSLACGLVQPLLNLWLTGSPAANGMRAKSWLYNHPFDPVNAVLKTGQTFLGLLRTLALGIKWDHQLGAIGGPPTWGKPGQVVLYLPPLLGLAGLAYLAWRALGEWRERRIGAASALLTTVMVALAANATMMTAEWHYYRYVIPFLTIVLIVGAMAVVRVAHAIETGGYRRIYALLVGALLVASCASIPDFIWRYREAVSTMVNQPMRLAKWIEANLPPGVRVGVHDCGAIRYYGTRPIYDLVGLTAPSVVSSAWRQGSGSMYEAMERAECPPAFFAVPDEAWTLPYLAKAGLFGRELFRVEHPDGGGVTAATGRQVVYAADWRLRHGGDRLYQENVLEIVRDLAFVDAVDIADLVSESDHRYKYWAAPGRRTGPSEVYRLTYPVPPHAETIDGGRTLSGGEAFDLRTRPGEDLVLIGRFMGMNEVWLQVRVNGVAAGWLYYPTFAGAWQERALRIPAQYITTTKTRIEILADNRRPGFEWHRPFYYWAFQGDLAAHEPRIAHPLDALTDGAIRLLGYDLELAKRKSGARLKVMLYWRAEQPIQSDLKVFVHWVDGQDRILTQRDSRPRQEAQPTWTWQPGFVVVDSYELELDSALPSLSAIYVGLYDAKSMEKHPLSGSDAAGRLRLTSLTNP